jgi:hypothetical protein
MLWREGYNDGQIKLALKATGRPLPSQERFGHGLL